MQKRKRNHWVSQSYLRPFAADEERLRVWRFSKEAGEPELKLIEKVAVRFYLYAPAGPDGRRDYAFEERLGELERWFGEPVWQKLCGDFVDLSWEPLRKIVALFAAVMVLRSPRQFETVKVLHRQFVDLFIRHGVPDETEHGGKVYQFDASDWPHYRDASEDDLKRHWLEDIGQAGWLAEKLMAMRWAVIYADEPRFITTDSPVTFLHPSLKFRGLNNPETRVLFPLSPTRILSIDNLMHEPHSKYYPLEGDGSDLNMLLWRGAMEHMFSPRDPYQVCAEMLADAERMGFAS